MTQQLSRRTTGTAGARREVSSVRGGETGNQKAEKEKGQGWARGVMPVDRNGVRYDPKKRPDNLEVFNGLTWWDMPGRAHDHDSAKLNFAMFKMGLYDPMLREDIEEKAIRRKEERFQRSIEGMRRRARAVRAMAEEYSEDPMADIKARSRAVFGFPPLETPSPKPQAPSLCIRKKPVDVLGRKYGQTTMEQRIELAARVDAWRAAGRYSRLDVLKAMGIAAKNAAFMCASGLTDGDGRWLVIAEKLPELEAGRLEVSRAYSCRLRRNDETRMANDERRAA